MTQRAAPQPRVRAARLADAEWLAKCAIAMAHETEGKTLDPQIVRAGIEAGLADPAKARYFIAMRDVVAGADTIGVTAGTLMLTHEWSDWRNGDWWWIQSVYVQPEHRRHGVFAALYHHVETLASADPAVLGLRLYVEKDNAGGQRTYAALGMQQLPYLLYQHSRQRDPALEQ